MIHKGLGKLLQAGGYERTAKSNRRMASQENSGNLLETVEEGQDKVQDD